MDQRSADVEAIANSHRRPDLYLLTDVDTPFVQDGTRDGALIREWMHEAFVAELTAQRRTFRLILGAWKDRFERSVQCIDEVMTGAA
jgi:nicotinamide riboside kinase